MAYIIFGDDFTFPGGDAATNRVYAYAKGILENGINVHVICFRNDYLNDYNGETEKIKYYHPFGQTKRSKSFLLRNWQKIVKYFNTYKLVKGINQKDKIVVLHCYTKLLEPQLFTYLLSKYFRFNLILERSEHPLRNYNEGTIGHIFGNIRVAIEMKFCNGIFCISDYLINFYQSRGFDRRRLLLVPSTVDAERFSHQFISPVSYKYILYCGSLTILKDGVDILIESFSQIAVKYPEINLILVGKADTETDQTYFENMVTKLNIVNRVFFTGKLPRTDIPAYLGNAEILALARPRSKMADAGFPSKLTEYLATGIPVVTTRVGEIPVYLTDSENSFLSEPDSISSFAEKLDFVLSNYEFAKTVAARGKELTENVFNHDFQAKRILEFVFSI